MLRRTISSACRRTLVPSRDIVAAPISRIASSVSLPPFDAVRPASTSSTLVNAMIWSKSEKKRCPEQVQRDMASVPGKKGVPPLDKRGDYSELTELDIAYFTSVLGEEGVIVDADDIEPYNRDWMKKWVGNTKLVLRPATTKQVSTVLAYCNERNLAVVPQGGNTGLVGGSVPVYDEIVLSLGRMDAIESLDAVQGIVTVQAGVILERLTTYLEENNFTTPLDLGAKGSCEIGGNLATNAGGLRYVRYGSLRGTVLGVEAVLADGTIIDTLSPLRKDNTGYDLKQLFIGSEGTLGVITRASILCPPKPSSVNVMFLAFRTFADVIKGMKIAREHLQEIISAIEFQDADSLDLVLRHISGTKDPLPESTSFYMLIETQGSNADHDTEKIATFLEALEAAGLTNNGTLADSDTQAQSLWKLRECISESLGKEGYVYKYDISLPVNQMYEMVEKTRMRLQNAKAKVVGYGHLGDGNLHLNIVCSEPNHSVLSLLEPWLFEELKKLRGSVSAEHGLGQAKNSFIYYSKSKEAVAMMQSIKTLFDPKGILNPYKVLPPKFDA